MRPSGNTPPANFKQQGITPLLSGIDGLYVGYYGEVRRSLIDMAVEGRGEVEIGDAVFRVMSKARSTYRLVLDNDYLSLALDNRANTADSPSVYVQVKSAFIWSEGLHVANRQVVEVMNRIYRYGPESEKVSRVDLFADFLWPSKFKESDVHKFVTKAKIKNVHIEGHQVSGFEIGKGSIHTRIYNKTLEARKSGKEWLFGLWDINPDVNDIDVWRVEFQLRRKALNEFGIECFDNLVNASQSIWDYCTGDWLSMRAGGKANVSRRQPTAFWKVVQAARLDVQAESPRLAQRIRTRSGMTEQQAVAQIAGIVRSFARRSRIASSCQALDVLLSGVRLRLGPIDMRIDLRE